MAEFKQGPRVQVNETSEDWTKLDTVYYVLPAGDCLPVPARYILDACRRVDPGYMLMSVRNVYRNPHGSIHYFDRYVTALGDDGTRMDKPHPDFLRFEVRYPFRYTGVRPHEILDIWEGDEVVKGLPGAYLPFTWAQVEDVQFFARKMEAIRAELEAVSNKRFGKVIPAEVLQRKIWEAKASTKKKAMDKLQAEVNYRWDHDWNYIRGLQEKTGHADLKEMGLA